ncbi:MAG: VapC toxin family PIN domain ribonuclease [Actinomycetota bacterium]
MTPRLALDAEAVAALGNPGSDRFNQVRAALTAAERLGREVVVTCVTLAELYRGRNRSQIVDAMLSRETGVSLRDTDRSFARLVGGVLVAAGAGSDLLADAHAVAAVVETGGGVVLTSDAGDLERLATPYPNIQISKI